MSGNGTKNVLSQEEGARLRRWVVTHEAVITGLSYGMVAQMAMKQLGFMVTTGNAHKAMRDMGVITASTTETDTRVYPSRILARAIDHLATALGHRFPDDLHDDLVYCLRGKYATKRVATGN